MKSTGAGEWGRLSPRLHAVREGDRSVPATEALGDPAAVYGERLIPRPSGWWRRWDPYRSKLSSALVKGFPGPVPQPGERWLYLGAATGTTASHIADLVGPDGAVYAVEMSLRPFARLLRLAEKYPNLFPVLGDARRPEAYSAWVPPVDGLYSDIAQSDQVGIARRNGELFLRPGRPMLVILKLASLGRGRNPDESVERALSELRPFRPTSPPLALEPFHRQHRFLAMGGPTGALSFSGGKVPSRLRSDRVAPRP
ncbi:MAG: fibrillarin-like rRNA/tRNA 2'-O-methyltransferase [Thermoplasmata archaeon]|nr:fibrillarin-like rRNA/tRNA 2'-O-methyltransferase [Thermoplasmata archaeon]